MPDGWCWCKLEELCAFLSRGKTPVYSETCKEYPVFAQKCNLKEGGISLEKALFLNPSTLPKWPKEYRLKTGDVLVNSTGTGTVGRTRLFNEQVLGPYPFVVPDSHVSVVRTFNQISSEYVFILLSSEYVQNYFADNLAGSTNQKELYIASIAELQVPLPPIEEQPRIAEQVSTLEDNIKILDEEKINIQSFVNSTKAKILELAIHGKLVHQDSSEEPAIELLKRINPDFTPSDNLHYGDKLPRGWSCANYGVINQHKNKAENPISSPDSTFELYSVPIYETGLPEYLTGREIGSTKQQVSKGDVLLCKINPHLNRVWVVSHFHTELKCIASSEWLIFQSDALLPEYTRLFFMSPEFRSLMLSNVSGVGGSLMRARSSAIESYPIWIPPIKEQKRIVDCVNAYCNILEEIAAGIK